MSPFFLNRFLPLVCYIIVFILVLVLNAKLPILTTLLFSANWIAPVLCLLLLLTKKRNILFRTHSFPRYRERKGWWEIISLQALLFLMYLVTVILFYKLTYPDTHATQCAEDLMQVFHHMSYHYGFFPWILYLILSLSFAYRYFNERKRFSLSRIIRHLVPHRQIGIISIGGHIYFRYITRMMIGFTISLFAFFCVKQTVYYAHIPLIIDMSMQTLFMMSALTMPLGMPWGIPLLKKIFKKCSFGVSILLTFLTFTCVLLFTTVLFFAAGKFIPIFTHSIPFPVLSVSKTQQLTFFTFCWWIGMSLPFCWCLARKLGGKTIGNSIVSLLIFPLCLNLFLLLPVAAPYLSRFLIILNQSTPLLLTGVLFGISFFAVFYSDKRNLFGMCSLTQKRLSFNAYRNFLQNSIFIFSIYLMTRFFMLYYFMVAVVIMTLIYLLSCALSFFKHLYFD
ncbi:MAG: BCCT family transporter [Gammaproteobacteria bacterium]|nr:BCCT family transporter [Gammaproteobacteria bacterium]